MLVDEQMGTSTESTPDVRSGPDRLAPTSDPEQHEAARVPTSGEVMLCAVDRHNELMRRRDHDPTPDMIRGAGRAVGEFLEAISDLPQLLDLSMAGKELLESTVERLNGDPQLHRIVPPRELWNHVTRALGIIGAWCCDLPVRPPEGLVDTITGVLNNQWGPQYAGRLRRLLWQYGMLLMAYRDPAEEPAE